MNESNAFTDNLNIHNGIMTYNDFDIDEKIPFEDQKWSYKCDIIQIEFGPRYTLDVGWYPEFDPAGHFLVRGIKDFDWLKPIAKRKCRSLASLKKAIKKTAELLSHEAKK
ncbi:hypothetical protein JST99_01075 [Candidatus Dependentiae bacterium]|nr:hypothetical protein [Candidatus Dependentiae bacterium]